MKPASAKLKKFIDKAQPVDIKFGATLVELSPAPCFSCVPGKPSLATIYCSHYDRLQAVASAARTGNSLLIKLALENLDRYGCGSDE